MSIGAIKKKISETDNDDDCKQCECECKQFCCQ